MEQISKNEFYDFDASHMVGVAADEREFYRLGDEALGVLAIDREDEIRIRGTVLRSSPPDGRYRNDGSNFESARNENGLDRAREKVEDWLRKQNG